MADRRPRGDYTIDLRTRVTPEQRERFDAIARRKGMPPAVYLRTLVIAAIEREDRERPR